MTKHKSKDRHTGGGQTKGKLEQSREEGVSMDVGRPSVFGRKWRLQGGYQGRGQDIVPSRLVKEFGSILGGIRGPGGFLFLFSFVLFFLNLLFSHTIKASILSAHVPTFLHMYTPMSPGPELTYEAFPWPPKFPCDPSL